MAADEAVAHEYRHAVSLEVVVDRVAQGWRAGVRNQVQQRLLPEGGDGGEEDIAKARVEHRFVNLLAARQPTEVALDIFDHIRE